MHKEKYNFVQRAIRTIYSIIVMRHIGYCHHSVRFNGIYQLCGEKYVSIAKRTIFGKDLFLTVWTANFQDKMNFRISIGADCNFGAYNHISCTNQITIGDGFLSGKWVTIVDNSHGICDLENMSKPPMSRTIVSKGPIIIEKNVWVGDKVTILPNVTIGQGAVIAANAVVTKDVPPFSVAAGNPARIVRKFKQYVII